MLVFLGAILFSAQVGFAVQPKPVSSLDQTSETRYYPSSRGYTTAPAPTPAATSASSKTLSNGYPALSSQTKALLEQCLIDDYLHDELMIGNNPYAGLLRASFHDCATSYPSNTTCPGGCRAWFSLPCNGVYDACEGTAPENNGLQPWITSVFDMYNNAKLNGKSLKTILSAPDFLHLVAHRAVKVAAGGDNGDLGDLLYYQGRQDPVSACQRMPDRLPGTFAWSEMQRVGQRNGMSDFGSSALLGAHTLGQAHPSASGYQGSWDSTPFVFDNKYWQALTQLKYTLHNVNGVNSQTGEVTTATQYSLGSPNTDSSLMLFCDAGQVYDTTGPCKTIGDSSNPCPAGDTPSIQGAITEWAANAESFYDAFISAYQTMSTWGCSDCASVPEYTRTVSCGSNSYTHTATKIYSSASAWWATGWANKGSSWSGSSWNGGTVWNGGWHIGGKGWNGRSSWNSGSSKNGGSSWNSGSSNGGSSWNGGSSNGGSSWNGGSSNGGSSNGGSSNGGSSWNYGSSSGGSTSGGTSGSSTTSAPSTTTTTPARVPATTAAPVPTYPAVNTATTTAAPVPTYPAFNTATTTAAPVPTYPAFNTATTTAAPAPTYPAYTPQTPAPAPRVYPS